MNMIIFSDNYPKLHKQTTAKLVAVEHITINTKKHKELLKYDCKKSDGTFFKIEDGEYIQLILIGNKHIPFCTLRKPQPDYKLHYYKKLIGKELKIVIKKDPQI